MAIRRHEKLIISSELALINNHAIIIIGASIILFEILDMPPVAAYAGYINAIVNYCRSS